MTEISSAHQINLVKDILNTHYGDGAATLSEYEQLYRSTNAIMNNSETAHLTDTIKAINGYSELGMKLDGYDEHLASNRDNISSWIQELQ